MKFPRIHKPFVRRELGAPGAQSLVLLLCVTLSVLTVTALEGFDAGVTESMLRDARALHGGDVIVRSPYEISPSIRERIDNLEKRGVATGVRVHRFYSVVRSTSRDDSLLVDLKAVEPVYPLYGRVELRSGRPLREVLKKGATVVEAALLERLGVKVGDSLHVGKAVLTIEDVVIREPDRPVNFFSFGPRVFVAFEDLGSLDLIKEGSRVRYSWLLEVRDAGKVEAVADELREAARRGPEQVETYRTARSRIKRFFDNFLFFLSLIAIFTLLLAGIGIQSTLAAYLRERERTFAILKALGATSRFILFNVLVVVLVLGLVGTSLGLACGFLLQNHLPALFRDLVPPNIEMALDASGILKGLFMGLGTVALFTVFPLSALEEVKPTAVFRKELFSPSLSRQSYAWIPVFLALFTALVLWHLKEVRTGLIFMAGSLGFIAATTVTSALLLAALKKLRPKSLACRQALKGLFRPRSATLSILVTLTASLTAIFSMYLLERSLRASYVESYPPDAPNLFFIDIQPSQLNEFSKALGMEAEYHSIVRARITAVKGEPVNPREERRRRGDSFARSFNLTYRSKLLDDEALVEGKSLFRQDWGKEIQVSVLDDVLEIRPLEIGDRITFNVQGIPLDARISSIRTRTRKSLGPFFYFVFPPKVLEDAPRAIFTAVRVDPARISSLQNRMVKRFPGVTVVDVTRTAATLAEVLTKLANIIRFFTLFSILAGGLILLGSMFATRFARIQETVYYKILGAPRSFIRRIFALESIFLGMAGGFSAVLWSQIVAWQVCTRVFNISYRFFPGPALIAIALTVLVVFLVGFSASLPVVGRKPAVFLREQTDE